VHLGIVARLVAPALGAAVLGYRADMPLTGLWWPGEAGGPVPLSVPELKPLPLLETGSAEAREWAERVIEDAIVP
jgi:hypothetical protein